MHERFSLRNNVKVGFYLVFIFSEHVCQVFLQKDLTLP